MKQIGKYFTALASAVATATLLSACGGGDAGAPFSPTASTGYAVDGYLEGSSIKCDASGVVVKTDSAGFFRFPEGCDSTLTLTGGTNVDTTLSFTGTLRAPAGSKMVTPLTTLLAGGMTQSQVNASLGLPADTDLTNTDPAYSLVGILVNPDLLKKTLAVQQLLMQTTDAMAAFAGDSSDATRQAIYSEVAAAFAAGLKGGAKLNATATTVDLAVLKTLVTDAGTRLAASTLVPSAVKTATGTVRADTFAEVISGGMKAQAEVLLTMANSDVTSVTTVQQTDTKVKTAVTATGMSAILALPPTDAAVVAKATALTDSITGSGGGGSSGGGCGITAPTCAPSAPTASAADVKSLYSDAYTSVAGFDIPNWGQGQMVTGTAIAGNNVLSGTAFTYQGFQFDPIDATALGLTSMHIDVWSADATPVKVYVISAGQDTESVDIVPTPGAWKGVDIPLSSFTKINKAAIFQVKLDTALQPVTKAMYFDNIYFGKAGTSSGGTTATAPTTAPSAPTASASDVKSLYSDAYTSVAGFDIPNWGQGQMVTGTAIAGNNVLSGTAFTYQGFQFDPIDATALGLTSMHIDVWSADATPVKVYVISAGQDTVSVDVVPTAGAWKSVDVPLSSFTNINKAAIIQVKLDTALQPVTKAMYFDNIYFGKAGGSGAASSPLVFSSNYSQIDSVSWRSTQGGDAGTYIDTGVSTAYWWNGVAPGDATPSFYFGYGINVSAKPWGFGAFVKAPANGTTASLAGYANMKIAVWGNDELMNTHPTLTVILKGATVDGCASELKGNIAVTAPGVQNYTLSLGGMTLQTACGYSTVAQALAAGVSEVHIQMLGANVQYVTPADANGNFANGLNVGPISFQ